MRGGLREVAGFVRAPVSGLRFGVTAMLLVAGMTAWSVFVFGVFVAAVALRGWAAWRRWCAAHCPWGSGLRPGPPAALGLEPRS